MGRFGLIIGSVLGMMLVAGGIVLYITGVFGTVPLASLLIQPGDLPAGYSGAQVRDTLPGMFTGVPTATLAIFQELEQGGRSAGGVTIFLYNDAAKRATAYDFMAAGLGQNARLVTGIGERAKNVSATPDNIGWGFLFSDLVFERCDAIVYMRFEMMDMDAVTAYAKRLDKRLQEKVC